MATETANRIAGTLTGGSSNTSSNRGISSSSAGIESPTASGVGAGGLQQSGKDLLNREISIDQRKGGSLGLALAPYQQQVAQGEAQKGIQGLSFARTLGDVRNRIAQDKIDAREQQAQAGFIGSGAQARSQVEENRKISNTLDTDETDYINNLRNLNATIGSARQQELNLGQPLIAKGVARQAAGDSSLYNFESDEGVLGKALGAFGKEQTSHATLDRTAFANNEQMQQLANQFGIDVNSPDFQGQVDSALGQILTTSMSSVYDPTIDIKYDDGSGLKTVATQTRSVASQIFGDILGVINVAGIAGIAITGGTSLMSSAAAETMSAIEAAGQAVGGAAETIEEIGAGLDMTASEALGSGFSGMMEQAAGEAGVELPAATEDIANGFANSIESNLGDIAFGDASAETVQAAMGAAKETFSQAIRSGASVGDAMEMATINAQNIIANSDMVGAAFETGAASTEGIAGVGTEAEAGVGAQTEAGVGAQTEAGAVTPEAGAPVSEGSATQGATTAGQRGLLRRAGGAIRTGARTVAKVPASIAKTAAKVA